MISDSMAHLESYFGLMIRGIRVSGGLFEAVGLVSADGA